MKTKKRDSRISFACALILIIFGACSQAMGTAWQEDSSPQHKVEQLEKAVAKLEKETATDGSKKSLWSSLDVQFYRHMKTNAAHNPSRT